MYSCIRMLKIDLFTLFARIFYFKKTLFMLPHAPQFPWISFQDGGRRVHAVRPAPGGRLRRLRPAHLPPPGHGVQGQERHRLQGRAGHRVRLWHRARAGQAPRLARGPRLRRVPRHGRGGSAEAQGRVLALPEVRMLSFDILGAKK